MKLKNLFVGAIAIAGLSAVANANTFVITGSSAYRTQAQTALSNLGWTEVAWFPGSGGSATSGNAQVYTKGSDVVKTSWSGSAAGIQTVAGPAFDVGVIPDSNGTTWLGVGAYPTDPTSSGFTAQRLRPDIAFADNTQGSTVFNSDLYNPVDESTTTYEDLTLATVSPTVGSPKQSAVGVVAFIWVASASASASPFSFTDYRAGSGDTKPLNITTQSAQALFSVGYISLALLTGDAANANTTVVATGRNPDSGTRIITFAESGIGINSVVSQYQATVTGGAISALSLWPTDIVNGLSFDPGMSGYSSGSNLKTAMAATGPGAGLTPGLGHYAGFLISYLSTGDGTGITGGVVLRYNGVPYSNANIQQGSYTVWGYENIYYRSTPAAGVKAFADGLATRLYNNDAAITIPSMVAKRSIDGGNVYR